MSLYSALYAGISGLNAQSSAMSTVADNIINVNTIGYKAVTSDFSTLVGEGGPDATDYSAGGVQSVAKQTISQNGMLQAASRNSDIAIDGNGFFVVRDGLAADSQTAYTRAGSFTPDKQGNLYNTGGFFLQGWPIGADGTVAGGGSTAALETVNMNSLAGTAQPTRNMAWNLNLQSTSTAINPASYDPADPSKNMADGEIVPQYTRSMTVHDQQGGEHLVNIGFTKSGDNEWKVEVYADKDELSGPPTTGLLASGTATFNADGSLASIVDAGGDPITDSFTINPDWAGGAGASPNPINLDLSITQTSDSFGERPGSLADGGLTGAVTDVAISKDGIVSAIFDDGTTRPIYQLPIALFANPDGLTTVNGNAYIASDQSGNASINFANSQGTGGIASKQLEGSTADIGTEFTNMIRFQRAYSASSKIITTVDQMLQELGNMKN